MIVFDTTKNRKEEKHMKNKMKIRKEMFSSDTEEVANILNVLDENSIILAKTYITALADKQKFELGSGERNK